MFARTTLIAAFTAAIAITSLQGCAVARDQSTVGEYIDDATITTAIKGKYLVDDTLKGLQISVETDQGVVVLTGSVQSDAAKELATQIAQGVEGVVRVDNQLTIQ